MLIVALGLGLLWHGVQIVWVAPTASQFRSDLPPVEPGSGAAFNRFWLDQYAWIGMVLSVAGIALVLLGVFA